MATILSITLCGVLCPWWVTGQQVTPISMVAVIAHQQEVLESADYADVQVQLLEFPFLKSEWII